MVMLSVKRCSVYKTRTGSPSRIRPATTLPFFMTRSGSSRASTSMSSVGSPEIAMRSARKPRFRTPEPCLEPKRMRAVTRRCPQGSDCGHPKLGQENNLSCVPIVGRLLGAVVIGAGRNDHAVRVPEFDSSCESCLCPTQ